MAETSQDRPVRQRPAAGVAIDPERMIRMRDWRALSRIELATRITSRSRAKVARVLGITPGVLRPDRPGASIPADVLSFHMERAGLETLDDLEDLLPDDVLARGLSRDSVNKFENGERHPAARTLRAICTALDCEPPYLMPDGPPFAALPLRDCATMARREKAALNRAMRDWADQAGISYRDEDRRIRYTPELRAAYAAHLARQEDSALAS